MIRRLAVLILTLTLLTGARAQEAYVVNTAGVAALVNADGGSLIQGESIDAVFELKRDVLYAVGSEGDYGLFDAAGNRLGDESYEMLHAVEDVILYRQSGYVGAMDLNGVATVTPEWDQLTYSANGAFLALKGDLYDDQPDELFSIAEGGDAQETGTSTASGLRPFSDGRMGFMLSDGQYGYVDARGRQVIPPEWRYAGDFSDGVAMVSDGSGMGLIDIEGRLVVSTDYDWMRRGEGMIVAHTAEGRVDVYSPDGAEKRFAIERTGEAEVCGAYVVARDGDAARLYDTNGQCVYEAPAFAAFDPGLNGQVIVSDGEWGAPCQRLVGPDGSAVSEAYQRILPLCRDRYVWQTFPLVQYEGDAFAGAQSTYDYDSLRCGLLDADGREILPADYLEILPSGDDRLVLVSEKAVAFADLEGNVLRKWPVTETASSSSEAAA